jgi:prefoldin beta subunit
MVEKQISKATQEKFAELQLLQQRLSIFSAQKQQFQLQLAEVENALAELVKAKPPIYKLVGELLIEKKPEELKTELEERKTELDIRVKSLDKQESKTKESLIELQKEISAELK